MLSKRILCSLVFTLCGGLVSAEDIVFLEDSMVKIPRDADLEVSRKSSFHLNASRNEHELFQVVVRPDCNTAMVTVAVSSLEDNAGNKIASDSISVYNAHYLTHENQISYPDALPRHTAIPVRKNTKQDIQMSFEYYRISAFFAEETQCTFCVFAVACTAANMWLLWYLN